MIQQRTKEGKSLDAEISVLKDAADQRNNRQSAMEQRRFNVGMSENQRTFSLRQAPSDGTRVSSRY